MTLTAYKHSSLRRQTVWLLPWCPVVVGNGVVMQSRSQNVQTTPFMAFRRALA